MSLSHIIVVVFMLITAAFVIWLEVNSRKNANQKSGATPEQGSGQRPEEPGRSRER